MTLYTAGLPTGPEGTVVQDGEIIMKSIDGGVTWIPMNNYPFLNIGKLLVDPINPEILYVLGDFSESRNVSRVYKSIDSGTTFSPINEGLPVASFLLSDVEIDPHNPSILYTTTFGNGVFVLEQQ
jgi:hypothetical protein